MQWNVGHENLLKIYFPQWKTRTYTEFTYVNYMTRLEANIKCMETLPRSIPSNADWKQVVTRIFLATGYHNHLPSAEAEIEEDKIWNGLTDG